MRQTVIALVGAASSMLVPAVPSRAVDTVAIPAGGFWMGRDQPDPSSCPQDCIYYDDELAIHWIEVPEFTIGLYEVTNAEFAAFLNAVQATSDSQGHPYIDVTDPDVQIHYSGSQWQADSGFEQHPVVEVSWYGADAYCRWVGGRLPTEAEWEKAAAWDATAQYSRLFPWGETFTCGTGTVVSSWLCNQPYATGITTRAVGSCPDGVSPYGLYDMSGNVWEWTMYGYTSYPGVPSAVGEFQDYTHEVQRGGSWRNNDYNLRCAGRNPSPRYITEDNVGFRVCYSPVRPSSPPVVVSPRSVYSEWIEDFNVSTPVDQTYTWWTAGSASYVIDAANGWMVATLSAKPSTPTNVAGEHMGMIRRDTGTLFAPGDYVDITVRLMYERGDRAYARTSVAVAWGDTRSIVPGGRGADENDGYPWFLVANNTDTPNTWHDVTLERVRWGQGKFCIGFGLWANLSDKANPPIVGQQRMWVDFVRVRHSQPWSPGDFVDLSANTTAGALPLSVQFTDHSQITGASGWSWEFGDGQTSTQQNPAHVYTAAGTYSVHLSVAGGGGYLDARKLNYIQAGSIPGLTNPSFEANGGSYTGWQIARISGEGPDNPPLSNSNPWGVTTPAGTHWGGKITNGLGMNFYLGQVIQTSNWIPSSTRVDWQLSALVEIAATQTNNPVPTGVHQVWEIGWMNDGSQPAGIMNCDHYQTVGMIDGNYTKNTITTFYPLNLTGAISGVNAPQGAVLRVHLFNDNAWSSTYDNIDNLSFTISSAAPTPTPPAVVSAWSVKMHGGGSPVAGDIPLAMDGSPVVSECRLGGVTQVAVNFDRDIVAADGTLSADEVVVSASTGTPSVSSLVGSGTSQLTVNLTGVVDRSCLSLTLHGIASAASPATVMADKTLKIRSEQGDLTGNGKVTSADVNRVKSLIGADPSANAAADVNLDGVIDQQDMDWVKAKTDAAAIACP